MNNHYFEIAMTLSRMYGVAETLHPLGRKPQEEFFPMIHRWTREYLESDETDLVVFFEGKIH